MRKVKLMSSREKKKDSESELFSEISSSLRRPLSTLLGVLELVGLEEEIPAELARHLTILDSAVADINSIANTLSACAYVRDDHPADKLIPFAPVDEFVLALDEMRASLARRGMRFSSSERLPSGGGESLFMGKPEVLRAIFRCLEFVIIEALGSSSRLSGSNKMERIDQQRALMHCVLCCSGVHPEEGKSLEDLDKSAGGSFPGERRALELNSVAFQLQTAYQLTRSIRGDLKLSYSPKEERFEFRMSLPLRYAKEDADSLTGSAIRPAVGKNVALLVEDDDGNAVVLTRFLEDLGYTVERVEDGLQAVDLYLRSDYAFALIDCVLPGIDGLKTATLMRNFGSETSQCPIVLMTANARTKVSAEQSGVEIDSFLIKPISKTDLQRVAPNVKKSLEKDS